MSRATSFWLLAAFVAAWLCYAAYVIRLIAKLGKYERSQLIAQSTIALTIPVLGAMIIHVVHRAVNGAVEKVDRRFDRSEYSYDDGKGLRGDKDE
jgi:hypothetical protein